jgi:acetyl-CoA synthetase
MYLSGSTYEEVYSTFRWEVPARFNIARAISEVHAAARPDAPAVIVDREGAEPRAWSFAEIEREACRFANALSGIGIGPRDVVGVHLPQSPECLIAHIAVLKLGAIVLPLFRLFGPDALRFRLADSGAKAFITSGGTWPALAPELAGLEALGQIVTVGAAGDGSRPTHEFWQLASRGSDRRPALDTAADDPAVIIYTSGTTGNPKGALHAHRVLLGHLPGVMLHQDLFPRDGDLFWTPADWAWIGGLLNVLWSSLYHGVGVVAAAGAKFDPDWAFAMLARHRVRNAFIPPTALRLMRQVPNPRGRYSYAMRSMGSGGETLGADLLAWGREVFDISINEFYGQTEVNLVLGNCASLFPARPGSMGRAMPGHDVAVVDDEGRVLPDGTRGIVAVRRPDPVLFLGYWKQPAATADKFRGDWCLLGDVATRDADGHFWFAGRNDDIINSAGYRIGPGEVEECIMRHPAVALAAVVGLPDAVRGEIVAAAVVLKPEIVASAELATEIQAFVKERLAAHEYPRIIRFMPALPTTVTGKVRRLEIKSQWIAQD